MLRSSVNGRGAGRRGQRARRRRQRKKDRKWIGDGRGLAEDGATRGARKSILFGKLLTKSIEDVPRRVATRNGRGRRRRKRARTARRKTARNEMAMAGAQRKIARRAARKSMFHAGAGHKKHGRGRRRRKKARKWIGDVRGLAERRDEGRSKITFSELLAKSMENVPRRMATASCN